jgi:hypothetical protein
LELAVLNNWIVLSGSYLCVCVLFIKAVSSSNYIAPNNEITNEKRIEKNWLFKTLSRHQNTGTEKNHEEPVRIAGLPAEVLTRDLPNTKQESKPLGSGICQQEVSYL